jgi:hypothetical protein
MVVSNADLLERHIVQPDLLASSSESDWCTPISLSILSEVEVDMEEYYKIATVRAPDITEVTKRLLSLYNSSTSPAISSISSFKELC